MRFVLASTLALTIALATGCRARTAADERRDYCEDNWTNVELFPPGTEPARPYQIVSAVDAVWFPTPERRAKKMQFKACLLHADAVLDRTEATTTYQEREVMGPWGVTTTRTTTQNPNVTPGKGYDIRWTATQQIAPSSPQASGAVGANVPPPAPQPPTPANPSMR